MLFLKVQRSFKFCKFNNQIIKTNFSAGEIMYAIASRGQASQHFQSKIKNIPSTFTEYQYLAYSDWFTVCNIKFGY